MKPALRSCLNSLLLLALASLTSAQTTTALHFIVQGLASPDFPQRQAAQEQLDEIPFDQYDALLHLAGAQTDPEVNARLQARCRDILFGPTHWRAAAHITGRILDRQGKPIAGLRVSANSPSFGTDLGHGMIQHTHTDAVGRFDLSVPFREIFYTVYISRFEVSAHRTVLVEKDVALGDIGVEPHPPERFVFGTLLDEAGAPAVNQNVTLLGPGDTNGSAVTDKTGWFNIRLSDDEPGPQIFVVHAGKLTVPLTGPGNMAGPLRLVPAGSLSGKVRSTTGQGVFGAAVYLHPASTSALLLKTITDMDGSYNLSDLPPGDYILTAEAPAYARRPPHRSETQFPKTTILSGKSTVEDILVEPMAILRGQVLDPTGKPVPNAAVGIISTWRGQHPDQWRCVQTDANGRFLLATGHTKVDQQPADAIVHAFYPQAGYRTLQFADLANGETRNVSLALSGAVRVAGAITDAAGKPLAGIDCANFNSLPALHALSDVNGHFDLGRVCLPDDKTPLDIAFMAPRPMSPALRLSGYLPPMVTPDFATPSLAPTFYAHQKITLNSAATPAALKITLAPVQLLEFHGTITDADGKPIPDAEVYLFTGDAKPDTWVMSTGRDRHEGPIYMPDLLLTSAKTDVRGRYTLWAVREDPASPQRFPLQGGTDRDYIRFAIGVYANERGKFTPNLAVPQDGVLETTIRLDDR